MLSLLRYLAPLIPSALAVISCVAPVEDAPAGTSASAQVAPACQIVSWSVYDTTVPAAPGVRQFTWKALNNGTVACPYKTQIIVHVGSSEVQGTIFSASALTPYTATGAKRTHTQTLLVGSGCWYEVWYKYKAQYPDGAEAWYSDGTYSC